MFCQEGSGACQHPNMPFFTEIAWKVSDMIPSSVFNEGGGVALEARKVKLAPM